VSGFGQVVSLWVRTKLPKDHPHTLDWDSIKDLKAERSSAESWSLESEKSKSNQTENIQIDEDDEYPYLELLNRLLPNEVRILAWAPVPTAFDARFSCKWRKYKYFFPSANLDITKMQQAAQLFIGTHDCRYICKIDPSKSSAPNFFRRDIYESIIETTSNPAFSVFIVKGRAFLWHQVRNMMALLFMVGQGMEEPSIITKMLNPSDDAGKPNYEMAPDAPLVLMECGYENLNWKTKDLSSNKNSGRTLKVIDEQWTESSLRVLQLDTLREEYLQLATGAESEEVIVFSKPTKSHVSLLKRSRAYSAQQVSEKRANKANRNEYIEN
jgi:tRNA pseudouridine38/39 synthase